MFTGNVVEVDEGRNGCLQGMLLKWRKWRSTVNRKGGRVGFLVSTMEVGWGKRLWEDGDIVVGFFLHFFISFSNYFFI